MYNGGMHVQALILTTQREQTISVALNSQSNKSVFVTTVHIIITTVKLSPIRLINECSFQAPPAEDLDSTVVSAANQSHVSFAPNSSLSSSNRSGNSSLYTSALEDQDEPYVIANVSVYVFQSATIIVMIYHID